METRTKDRVIRTIGMIFVSVVAFIGCYHGLYVSNIGGMLFQGSLVLFFLGYITFVLEWDNWRSKALN